METTGKVGELQTTVDNPQRQLNEAKAELKRAIESQPQASKEFKRKLGDQIQRRNLLPGLHLKTIKERARGKNPYSSY